MNRKAYDKKETRVMHLLFLVFTSLLLALSLYAELHPAGSGRLLSLSGEGILSANATNQTNATTSTSTASTSSMNTATSTTTESTLSISATSTSTTTSISTSSTTTSVQPTLNTTSSLPTTSLNSTSSSTSTTSLNTTSTTSLTTTVKPVPQHFRFVNAKGMSTAHISASNSSVNITSGGSSISGLDLNLNQSGLELTISMSNSSSLPAGYPQPPSRIYQFIQINGTVGHGRTDNVDRYLKNVTYNFSVSKNWLREQGMENSSVRLFKYSPSQKAWIGLGTTLTGSNDTSFFYSAVSSSLSSYIVAFTFPTTLLKGTTMVKTLSISSSGGWQTYLYAMGQSTSGATTITCGTWTTNTVKITSNEVCNTAGNKVSNVTAIGVLTGTNAQYGNVVGSTTTGTATYNDVLVGLGANVIFNNNAFSSFTTSSGSSPNSITFTTTTPNSVVFILWATSGNDASADALPAAGCTDNLPPGTINSDSKAVAAADVANCIIASTGSYTVNVAVNGVITGDSNSIAAIGFPEYGVWLKDSPGSGNIATSPCATCTTDFNQQSGNVVNVIGDNTLKPIVPTGYTFNSFVVDWKEASTYNSANIVLTSLAATTTNYITVMGNAIVTATYLQTLAKSSATVSNSQPGFGGTETLTITVTGGTTPYSYNFLVTNTAAVGGGTNIIFSTIISNALTTNTVSFTVPADPNAIGTMTFTANVVDSSSPSANVLFSSIVFNGISWDGSTQCTNNYVGPAACQGSITYSAGTTLKGIVNASNDIIINTGVIVDTSGYHLIAGNMIDVEGTGSVRTDSALNGGAGGSGETTGAAGSSATGSFGGSGGAGGSGYLNVALSCTLDSAGCELSGKAGGATLAAGGTATSGCTAGGNGGTPSGPVFTNANVIAWYANAQANVVGAGGSGGGSGDVETQTTCMLGTNTVSGGNGGAGTNGVIEESNTIIVGKVTANGNGGANGGTVTQTTTGSSGGGGGGGGGAALFIWGQSYTVGTVSIGGGSAGSAGNSNAGAGGSGGSGQSGTTGNWQYTTAPLGYVPPKVIAAAITPAPPTLDAGQSITLTANPNGGRTPYGYKWYTLAGSTAPYCTTVNVIAGQTGSTISVTPSSTNSYAYNVIDDYPINQIQCSQSNGYTITVNPQPTVTMSVNAIFDSGQVITFKSVHNAAGGTGTFTDQFTNVTSGTTTFNTVPAVAVGATVTNLMVSSSPTANNVFTWNVISTDTGTTSAYVFNSVSVSFAVNTLLLANVPTVSSPTIDSGQSSTLTSKPAGGSSPYTYKWYTIAGVTAPLCTSANIISGATSSTYAATPTASNSYAYQITDSATTTNSVCSSGNTITVNPALAVSANTISNTIADQGQATKFTFTITGGSPNYNYNVMLSNTLSPGNIIQQNIGGAVSSTTNTLTVILSTEANVIGALTFSGNVVDSASTPTNILTTNSLTVKAAPTATLSVNSIFDSGQVITFKSAHNSGGGAGTFTDQFTNVTSGTTTFNTVPAVAVGATVTNLMVSSSPTANNVFTWNVISSDTGTTTAFVFNSVSVSFAVNTAITATAPTSASIDAGQTNTLFANPSGGSSPFTYKWYTIAGATAPLCTSANIIASATSASYAATPASTNSYVYQVTDSATTSNVVCSSGATLTVNTKPTVTISFTNSLIDSGQTQNIIATLSGGTGPFTVNFFNVTGSTTFNSVPGVSVGGTPTNIMTVSSPTNGNTFTWNIIAVDKGTGTSFVFNSVSGSFTENAALTLSTKTASNTIADQGQAELLTITISGGTSPYTYNFMFSNTVAANVLFSSTVSNSFTGNVVTFTLPTAAGDPQSNALGTLTFSANVVDGATTASRVVGTTTVTGKAQPTVTMSVNAIFDSGQTVTFTSTHNSGGGAGTFKDQFYNTTGATTFNTVPGIAVAGTATNLMVSSSPTANNVFTWNVISSDTGTTTAFVFNSVSVSFAVNTAITATAPASATIDAGQSNTLFSSVSGGSSPYTYKWYTIAGSTAPLCTSANIISGATSSSYAATPASTNSYAYQVTDSATTANVVCSSGATLTVNTKPTVQSFTGNAHLDSGQKMAWSFKLTGGASAGTGPFTMNFFNVTGSTTFNTVPNVAVGGTATNAFITSSPTDSNTFTWNGIAVDTGTATAYVFNSLSASFTVNTAYSLATKTVSNTVADQGQAEQLKITLNGGTSSYTYNFLVSNTNTAPNPANVIFSSIVSNSFKGNVINFVLPVDGNDLGTTVYFTANAVDSATLASNVLANTAITVYKQPTVTMSVNAIFDSGQTVTFTSTHNSGGGAGTFKDQFYNTTGATTFNTVPGIAVAGTATNLMVSSSPTANNVFTWNVISSDTGTTTAFVFNSVSVSFAVNTVLVAGAITPSAPTIDSGQSITLTSAASGGSSPYTYKWYTVAGSSSPICTSANIISGAASSTYTASPTSTNTYSYQVSDSATTPNSVCSSGDTVIVSTALSTPALTGNALLDSGQKQVLSTTWSSGTSTFTAKFYNETGATTFNTVPGATSPTTNTFIVSSPTNGNTFTWNSVITDSAYSPVTHNSLDLSFTVNAALAFTANTLSNTTADQNQRELFTMTISGGTAPYSYNFLVSNTNTGNVIFASVATNSFTGNVIAFTLPNEANDIGKVTFTANVVDSATLPANILRSANIVVDAQPTVTLSISNTLVDSGQYQKLTAQLNAGGGTGTFKAEFFNVTGATTFNTVPGIAIGASATNTFIISTPTDSNTFTWNVIVLDTGTTTAYTFNSVSSSFIANAALATPSITPPNPQINSGQSQQLTASWSGGIPKYTITWFDGSSSTCSSDTNSIATYAALSGTSNSLTVTPAASKYYCVGLTDSATTAVTANSASDLVSVVTLTVNSVVSSNSIADQGQRELITTKIGPSTSPYNYNIMVSNTAAGNVLFSSIVSNVLTTNSVGFTIPIDGNAIGTITYSANVVDGSGNNAIRTNTITIDKQPAVTFSANSIFDTGQTIVLTSTHNSGGGAGTFKDQFFNVTGSAAFNTVPGVSVGGSATNSMIANTPINANAFTWNVISSDTGTTSPFVFNSAQITFTVNSPLLAPAPTASASTINFGSSVTLTASPAAGTPPYTYNWFRGGSATCSGDSLVAGVTGSTYTDSPASDKYYCYTATDLFGSANTSATTLVHVSTSGGGGGGGGGPPPSIMLTDNVSKAYTSNAAVMVATILNAANGQVIATIPYYQNQLPASVGYTSTEQVAFRFICSFLSNGVTYMYQNIVYGLGTGYQCGQRYTISGASYNVLYGSNVPITSTTSVSTTSTTITLTTSTTLTTTVSALNTTSSTTSLNTTTVFTTINTTSSSITVITVPGTNQSITNIVTALNISSSSPVQINFTNANSLVTVGTNSAVGSLVNIQIGNAVFSKNLPKLVQQQLLSAIQLNIRSTTATPTVNMIIAYPCNIQPGTVAPYRAVDGNWVPITPYSVNQSACTIAFAAESNAVVALLASQKGLPPEIITLIEAAAGAAIGVAAAYFGLKYFGKKTPKR